MFDRSSGLVVVVALTACLACISCDRQQSSQTSKSTGNSSSSSSNNSSGGSAIANATAGGSTSSGTPSSPTVAPAPAPAAADSAAAGSLPRAEDVLPDGEVSRGSLVVIGDGYRFQIKPEFKPVPHPQGKTAYVATVDGLIAPAELTFYVTREPFSGDQDALAKRQMDAVRACGGKVSMDESVLNGYRFFATGGGKFQMQLVAVNAGTGYVFHAETPLVPNAYANVGSDMTIRGATFRVGKFEPKQPAK